jgi:hypothetical protein
VALLAGCGGGGGSAGPASLDATTAPVIAADVLGGFVLASNTMFLVRAAGRGAFLSSAVVLFGPELAETIGVDPPPPLTLRRGDRDCDGGGKVTVAGTPDTDADLAPGATYFVSYLGCTSSPFLPVSIETNGRWDFMANSFSGQLQSDHELSVDVATTAFVQQSDGGRSQLGLTGGWISSRTGSAAAQTLLADQLDISFQRPGGTSRYAFRDMSLTATPLGAGFDNLLLEGSFEGAGFAGTVTVATEEPVQRGSTSVPGPASGAFVVRSGTASMRVTLVVSDQLEIALDADGDGVAEQLIPVQLVNGRPVT